MKINKEQLIEDLRDTQSNNFDDEFVDYLFEKYSKFVEVGDWVGYDVVSEESFRLAMHEFLDMIITFIANSK